MTLKFKFHLKQLQEVADFIRDNADNFKVVVLTLNDALYEQADTTVDAYQDDIDYLKEFLGATLKDCSSFNFLGGWFS